MAAGLIVFLFVTSPAGAATPKSEFRNHQEILAWMEKYRYRPEPKRLPRAVHAMRAAGLFEDLDNAGLFIGFIAGVLNRNPKDAKKLLEEMFPIPPKEQGVIIKAIAYSGLPDWKHLMGQLAERMPGRATLIEAYLFKNEKTLMEMPLEKGPFVIDALWGFYYATGDFRPVGRILSALRWSEESNIDKFTAAHTAKWTLAANGERNRELLDYYRQQKDAQDKKIKAPLKKVIKAVENYHAARIRKEALAAIEVRKQKGPVPPWGFAAEIGSTTLSVGCVIASAAGQPHIAAPCVVAGAVYSGAMHLWKKSQQ